MSEAPARAEVRAVVWDLGGVLIDWDPRYLYRSLLADDEAVETFLRSICTTEWNHRQDEGRSFDDGVRELVALHPAHEPLIRAYAERWLEMLGGPIADNVALLEEVAREGVPQFALTNWSAETFPQALELFPFLASFEGIVVSGREGVAKPDRRLFRILIERHGLEPSETLYIDDARANVEIAALLGFRTELVDGSERLRDRFRAEGLLGP